ncbi:spore gernimation protein GerA [Bacillus pseudomycoides]|uniref:spore gernimation protein GerA n=1 Tax=Bacillus pseudomycoides TaxID=64104 RepID=UPI00211D981A|nr:spore gernimation protein GerA [Bacillus pseudomycoides]
MDVYKFEMGTATSKEMKKFLKNYVLTVGSMKECDVVEGTISESLTGYTVLLIDGMGEILLLET